jgi:putative addiction module killer protein
MFEVIRTNAFATWLQDLEDRKAAVSINARVARLSLGNFGDHKPISDGLSELRIDTGPGYRVYYTRRGRTLIMLLIGGAKGTQKRDIKRAQEMMEKLEG